MYEHTHTDRYIHIQGTGKYTKGCKIFMRLNKLTSREKMSFAAKKKTQKKQRRERGRWERERQQEAEKH